MMVKVLSSQETQKLYDRQHITWRFKPRVASSVPQKRGVFTSTSSASFSHEVGGNSLSVQSLGRRCDELGYSCSWQTGGNPTLTNGERTIKCCTDNFVPLVAVTQQIATPSVRHDPAIGNPVPGNEVKGIMLKLLVPFSDSFIDDAVLVRNNSPLARKRSQRHDCGDTTTFG